MNTKRILMIAGAVIMIAGFAITVISGRILHEVEETHRYIGMALGVVGLVAWQVGKAKS